MADLELPDSLPQSLPDVETVRGFFETPLGILSVVAAVFVVVFVVAHFSGRIWGTLFSPAPKVSDDHLKERLAEYPPPPGKPGPRRLTIDGAPVRLRLVVVAPVGRSREIEKDQVNELLNNVVRGLAEVIQRDKPRVRFWPAQLSNTGFAPVFHRQTEVPDEEGEPSCWVLIAGAALSAGRPILVGLACLADEPNEMGQMTLNQSDWAETVRVQALDS
jgi:hypothetical protein